MSQLEPKQAASTIEKWISFYDMDNAKAWDKDDYPFIQSSCKVMRSAIQALRGKAPAQPNERRKIAAGLEEWLDDSFMDDPNEWEKENKAFVQEALEAIQFTIQFLQK